MSRSSNCAILTTFNLKVTHSGSNKAKISAYVIEIILVATGYTTLYSISFYLFLATLYKALGFI